MSPASITDQRELSTTIRKPRDLGLGGDEVQEGRHRLFRLEQVCVHVDVEEVGTAAHLIQRDVERALEVAGLDQPPEERGAGDVRPLADHREVGVLEDREGLEPAEAGDALSLRDGSRGQPPAVAAMALT